MKKLLKKIDARLFIIVAALSLCSFVDVSARSHQFNHRSFVKTQHKQCKTVGAPLDGGLLTVLLGAGALFFVTRKKQKEQ